MIMRRVFFVLLLTLAGGVFAFAAGPSFQVQRFSDIAGDAWFFAPVHTLRLYGIVSGYDGNDFRPANFVKRAELAAMLVRTIEYIAHPAGKDPWRRFAHSRFPYAISYPSSWVTVLVEDGVQGFRPPQMPANFVQWAVLVFLNRDDDLLINIIDEMRSEYPQSASVTGQEMTLNDMSVTYLVATSPENPVWRREQAVIRHLGQTYVIANGGIENRDFEIFWRSFAILPSGVSAESQSSEQVSESVDGMPEWLKNISDVE